MENQVKHQAGNLFTGITRNVIILGVVSLFTDLGSQMIFPLIPLYLTSVLGAGAFTVGIVEGSAEASASLLKVVSGIWSDKTNKRKPFVLFGYSLSSLIKPLFAFAHVWGWVLFIRVIERIGKGLRTAPRDAILAESVDEKVRGRAYGFHRAMDGIGSTLGAVMAFLLLPLLGYKNLFLFAFIPGVISVVAIFFVKEAKQTAKPKAPSIKVAFGALPSNLRWFIACSSLFAMGHFGYAFLLLKAKDTGFNDQSAIALYVLFYLVYTLVNIPSGIISDKIGRKPVLIAGYLLFALISFGLMFTTNIYSLSLFFILYGIFYAMIDGVQRAFVVDLAPANLKATALGTFHTAIGVVALPGGYFAGLLWDKISPEATFIYGAVLSVISLIMLIFVKKDNVLI